MHTLYLPLKDDYMYFPEHLGECDAAQYADMSKLIFMFQHGEIGFQEFKNLAVYALLRLRPSGKKYPEIFENVYQLGSLVETFFDKEEKDGREELKIKQYYVNNHLPKLRVFPFRRFHGPEDIFEDVEFGQYVDGLEEFINYADTGESIYLRKLFAIFYLPKGEQYDPKTARQRARTVFRFVDIRHLYGFYLYFSAMQLFIMSGEIVVQGNSIDLSIIYQSGKAEKSTMPGIGMYGVMNDIAESGVFGSYASVRRANFWAVQRRLYQLQKNNLEEKKNEPVTT